MRVRAELKLDPGCVVPMSLSTVPHRLHWLIARREGKTSPASQRRWWGALVEHVRPLFLLTRLRRPDSPGGSGGRGVRARAAAES